MAAQYGLDTTEDRTVQPDLERAAAKRMGATTVELKSSVLADHRNSSVCFGASNRFWGKQYWGRSIPSGLGVSVH
jgi:hypothetical protein